MTLEQWSVEALKTLRDIGWEWDEVRDLIRAYPHNDEEPPKRPSDAQRAVGTLAR